MRRSALYIMFAVLAVLAAGCATASSRAPLLTSAGPTTVILGTAIIAPDALLGVVEDAIRASPEHAVVIAAAAAAAAPKQATAVRVAAVRLVPEYAEAIFEVTTVKTRRVVARLDIPSYDRLAALVENATRQ